MRLEKYLVLILIVAVAGLATIYIQGVPNKNLTLEEYAGQVLGECADENYKPSCYDEEIPKLMDYISMEDAFKVTSLVQKANLSFTYCHVLAHNLSAREVQKNPDDWKDVVIRCPSGMCSNGCLHGGFQERFRAETFTDQQVEELIPDLTTLCEPRKTWEPTGLEQASCYHALGHLTMYLTNADIQRATQLCDRVVKRFLQICFDGVFMQIFQPLEPEDFALIAGKEVNKEELKSFCEKFDGQRKSSCWTEGWPLFRDELQKPEGLVDYCSEASTNDPDRCYNVIIYVLTAQFGLEPKKVIDYCSGLPKQRQGGCFANGASRMIEVDYALAERAAGVCNVAADLGLGDRCFGELLQYSTYNYHAGSEGFFELCNTMPDPWKNKCLNRKSK